MEKFKPPVAAWLLIPVLLASCVSASTQPQPKYSKVTNGKWVEVQKPVTSGNQAGVTKALDFALKYCMLPKYDLSDMKEVLTREGFSEGGTPLFSSDKLNLAMGHKDYPNFRIGRYYKHSKLSGDKRYAPIVADGQSYPSHAPRCVVGFKNAPKDMKTYYDIVSKDSRINLKTGDPTVHPNADYYMYGKIIETDRPIYFKIPFTTGEISIHRKPQYVPAN